MGSSGRLPYQRSRPFLERKALGPLKTSFNKSQMVWPGFIVQIFRAEVVTLALGIMNVPTLDNLEENATSSAA